jgi:hypothetical protein
MDLCTEVFVECLICDEVSPEKKVKCSSSSHIVVVVVVIVAVAAAVVAGGGGVL